MRETTSPARARGQIEVRGGNADPCNYCKDIDLRPALLTTRELELSLVGGIGVPSPFQDALELGQLQIQFPCRGWNFEERRYRNAVPPHPCSA